MSADREIGDQVEVAEYLQPEPLGATTITASATSSKTVSVVSTTVNDDTQNNVERLSGSATDFSATDAIVSEKSAGDGHGKDDGKNGKEKEEKVSFFQLFRFSTLVDKLYMTVGLLGAVGNGAALPLMTIVMSDVLGELISFAAASSDEQPNLTDHLTDRVRTNSLYFVALGAGTCVLAYLQTATWMVAGERQAIHVRTLYYRAILRQDISWFDSVGTTGNVISRISGDVDLFQEGISEKVSLVVQYCATFITGFIIAYIKGWKLALVLTAVVPLLAITAGVMAWIVAAQSAQGQDAYAAAGTIAEQALSGIRTVVAFGGQEREIARYVKRLDLAHDVGKKKALAQGIGIGSLMFVVFATYALGFWYGGKLIQDSNESPTSVLNVFFSVLIGAFSLGNAAPNLSSIGQAMGAAANLFRVIDRVPPIDSESESGRKLQRGDVKGRIEFRHVKFHYPTRPNVPILKDFSLTIEPGETVALVGSSGSGKSTCVGLLERFYDPVEGDVFLDGINVKDISVKSLRSQIGLVGQEPVLFPTTVFENVQWGGVTDKEPPTIDEVKEACRKANAHEFIDDLPEKYETDVGEKGSLLSGGQKQRIAIARAIVKNPSILLLDEATSALDTESERLVQAALDAASTGRTTIVIAHRLSTVKNADKIVVMSQGEIIEVGRHEELIAKQGVYYGLVKAQELKTAKDDDEDDDSDQQPDEITVQVDRKRMEPVRRMSTYVSITKSIDEIREEDDERAMNESMPLWRVFKLNAPELPLIAMGVVGATINGAIMPMFAFLFVKILEVFARTDMDYLREGTNFWAGMFLVIAAVAFSSNVTQHGLFTLTGESLTRRIRSLTFSALMKQEIGYFDDERNATGVLTSKLAVDASRVEGLAGSLMGTVFETGSSIVTGVTIAFIHGWKYSLVCIAASPAIVLGSVMQMKALSGFGGKTRKAYDKSGQIVQQSVSNMRTIASLVREDTFHAMYAESIKHPHEIAVKGFLVSSIGFGVSQGIVFLVYALAFWYGGKLVTNFEYSVTDMENVLYAVIFTCIALGRLSTFAPNTAKAKIAAVNIFDILDRVPRIDTFDDEGKDRPAPVTGFAHVEDVRFRYPARPDVPILRGISLDVLAGKTVALVGGSGSGKSTIVSLLLRFYDVLSGKVEIERQDVRDWSLQYLRNHIALVQQEPMLFDLTIGENIAYGKEGATQEDILEAAKAANIHNFISGLPRGYETPVGEKGTQLSGGQKQRIAIARAVIRNPRLLLLDEATSALDSESEKVVQAALDHAAKDRTTVTIAHRLSTIQNADLIVVMRKGRIVETGRHLELVAKKGFYYELVNQQMLTKKG